jgi:hypothetical protein
MECVAKTRAVDTYMSAKEFQKAFDTRGEIFAEVWHIFE